MIVELNPGEGTPLAVGAEIPSRDTGGLLGALSRAGELVGEVQPVIENVRRFTEGLADEQFRDDLHRISHNVAELTRMIVEEDGTIPRLIRDPELADRVEGTLTAVQVTTTELAQTSRNIRAITSEIRDGDGTAHELIYGQEGVRLLGALADTAGEAATILRDVRTGEGNAHELLYGDSAGDLIENLTAVSSDLRVVMADVRAGRGTIGGLLVDPSIYEDVKRIVGNLERNDILRALVRYSIREDQPMPATPPPVLAPEPAAPTATTTP
jgi:phospholipid/cholesterol/gamma-HCH transport system substrate-binding protein